jgi:undecaprenyl-diphosphatase
MNPFDSGIVHFLNQFAQRSRFFDYAIDIVTENQLVTAVPIVAVFWWAWFRDGDKEQEQRSRKIIVSSLFLCTAAIFVARILALTLPFRERPIRSPNLDFKLPFGVDVQFLMHWSSFPSDHAVFFFCLATSIFLISRKVGALAYAYVTLVCGGLVYLGIHYPTDILAGALLGIAIASLVLINPIRDLLSNKPMQWFERSPASFYPCFYLVTFLFGSMFESFRSIALAAWHAGKDFIHH